MSQPIQTQFKFARTLTPAPGATEPNLWFQELRLLRYLSNEADAEIRRIRMRQGLNILWSPPDDAEDDAELYREAWGGHAAGKTLFCRILRYLLGDTTYCTESVLDNVKGKFVELWAVAHIRVLGESWIVGRSLVHSEGFALRSDKMEQALESGAALGNISAFFAQLDILAGASLKSLYPVEAWRHLLPWLARDQEARYARVTAWRDSLSEADNPSTSMNKQYALMRAVLGLLNPLEHELQVTIEQREEAMRRALPLIERMAAVEEREKQLLNSIARQSLGKDLDLGDVDAAVLRVQSHREVRQERLEQLKTEPESEPLRKAREAYEKAFSELTRIRQEAQGYGHIEAAGCPFRIFV